VRILVTNDDGIRAPGIGALARMAVASGHDIVVVAPLVDYSGAGAAVGPVHSRQGVDYEAHAIEGLDDVPTYGIDGPPALAVILACVGGFGPRPDVVLSGVNHGANVGRSALHSGTIGAALAGAHFGLRGLAVSMRWGEHEPPWATATTIAAEILPLLADAAPGTVLNLNVPDVPLALVKGLRRGRLGRSGAIRSAVHEGAGPVGRPAAPHVSLPPAPNGTLRLDLAPPWRSGDDADLETDAGLVARDYASLTALTGVREADGSEAAHVVEQAIARAAAGLGIPGPRADHRPPRHATR